MKVAYHVPDDGACTYYRTVLPLQTARRHLHLDCLPVHRGEDMEKAIYRIKTADVIAVARIDDPQFPEVLDAYHKAGKKVVMDWDDDIFNVSPMSDFYANLGIKDITVTVGGQSVDVWQDGKNGFDIKRNLARRDTIKKICEGVDMITVTTDILAGVYRQFNENVRVLPNCVDMKQWQKLPLIRTEPTVRMGWFGGSSHYEDWLILAQILPEIMAKYPQLRLVIMGQKFDGTLKGIPAHQIESYPWIHTQAYPLKAAILDLDFAVIPLQDNEFNCSKSPIKYVEMGALGVPAVVSHVSPYAEVMDLVPDNGLFVENTPEAWEAGISQMIEKPELRRVIGQQAQQTVKENFDIEQNYSLWINAFKEAMVWQPRQTQRSTR